MHPVETELNRSAADRSSGATPAAVDDPRVYLAAERTFLAWVRTSVALMGLGFLIARFAFWLREYSDLQDIRPHSVHRPAISPWLGFGMVVVGVLVCVMAATRHRNYILALQSGIKNPPLHVGASLAVAVVLALVGLAMALQILFY
jgi:putative membrane protein